PPLKTSDENAKPKVSRARKKQRKSSELEECSMEIQYESGDEYNPENDRIPVIGKKGAKATKPKGVRKVFQELQTRTSSRLQAKELEKIENGQADEEVKMALMLLDEDKEELQELSGTKKTQPSRKMNGGLTNLGNTCYMNAIIQALFALPVFISSLRIFTHQLRDSQREILKDSLLEYTQKLFEADDPEVRETLTTKFREIFISKHQQFDNNDMQDAHEFLITLMESLRAEIQIYNYNCPITENFEIELLNERTCPICNTKSYTTDKELTLSMTVPENRQSVQHCITNHFFSSEVEKHCDKCEMNTTHKIKTRISKNPKVMIIHFQRLLTEWNREENNIVCKKITNTIELSTTVSVKYVVNKDIRESEAKHRLSSIELDYAKSAVEKLRVIETKKTAVNSSGSGVSDDFFKKKLGPRAVKQLTEEQQLKYALQKSLISSDEEEIEADDAAPMIEPSSIDSTSSYLSPEQQEQLNDNSKIKIKEQPIVGMSYGLLATINHHGKEANSGHYTSDVLNICSQRWTSFSDNRVRTIQENTVLGRRNLTTIQLFLDKDIASQIQSTELK
ncbi:unnamed protein product, partial [Oikopleura dioica]